MTFPTDIAGHTARSLSQGAGGVRMGGQWWRLQGLGLRHDR